MTDGYRVLLVDDDKNLLSGLVRQLGERFDIATAENGATALEKAEREGPFAAVLCDMRMPGMDGIEVLRRMSELSPDTVRMMLTGNADQKTAVDAINRGAIFRFFGKPTALAVLAEGIEAAIQQYRLVTAERQLLENTLAGSISLLVDVLATVAPDTFQRSRRIRGWAATIGRLMKVENLWALEMAAEFAQLGTIAMPPDVLARHNAAQRLSAIEQDMVERIPEIGAMLIRKVPRLEPVADAVLHQSTWHQREPQAAPPPLAARILHVLIELDRAGRGNPTREAIGLLERQAGRFDPAILAVIKAAVNGGLFRAGGGADTCLDVPVSGLRIGDILDDDLTLENDRLVLAAGETITDALYARVQNIHQMTKLREPIRVRRPAVPASRYL